jgi:hypothetical protein
MFFIHSTILPLLFSIALLFFLINATRYFIIEGADSGGRERAKELALYGIGAFVFLISIWGIVNMFVNGLGIANDRSICPDYLDSWCNYSGYGGLGSPSEGNRFLDSGSDDSGATFEERCYEYGGVTNCTTVPTTKRCYEYGGVTDCP